MTYPPRGPVNLDGIRAASAVQPLEQSTTPSPKKRPVSVRAGKLRASAIRTLIFGAGMCTTLILMAGVFYIAVRVSATASHEQGAASSHAGHQVRQPTAVTNGLVAWYPFDGSANDASGNSINLSNIGNASLAQGKFGQSYSFNGSQMLSSLPNPKFDNLGDMSMSMWIYPSDFGDYANQYQTLLDSWNGGGSSENYYLTEYGGGGKLKFNRNIGGTELSAFSNTKLTNGAWQLVTVTFSGSSNLVSFYYNGVADGTTAWAAGASMQGAYPLKIGNGVGPGIVGSLDDIRLYNRTLTASDVTSLYQGSQPSNCDQYCAGWWKFDEASGTTAKDSSGNGNAGTLTNFTFDGTTNGWTGGVFGNALQINGSSYVKIPHTSSMDFTAGLTVECWVKYTGGTIATTGFIEKGDTYGSYDYGIGIDSYGRFGGAVGSLQTGTSSPYPTNTWHHLALTYDGLNEKLYVDGKYVAGSAGTNALHASAGSLWVSNDHRNTGWNGLIDDVRVYSRALTDYEVYDQYLAGN